MSGIGGLFKINGQRVEREELARMNSALAPQGSDGSKSWFYGSLGLTFRLMRFTAEDLFERQPLSDQAGRQILVADARLDNRDELQKHFGISPSQAKILPDSAFILKGYQKWGEACPSHFEGDFVFVIWDAQKQQLFAARDHFGKRSLFYYHSKDLFAFSSTTNGLFALPQVPRQLNEQKVAEYLALLMADTSSSFFEDIQRLPPAHSLRVDASGIKLTRYWELQITGELPPLKDEEYVEAFQEQFDAAVARSLRTIHPIAISMSGGLDSSSIAAVAAKQMAKEGKVLTAYTSVPRKGFKGAEVKGRMSDESVLTDLIAKKIDNLNIEYVYGDERKPLTDLDNYFLSTGTPMLNPCNQVWLDTIYQRSADNGQRVMLSGIGGNMTLSWQGSGLLHELAQKGHFVTLIKQARLIAKKQGCSLYRVLASRLIAPYLPNVIWQQLRRKSVNFEAPWSHYSAINPAYAKQIGLAERFKALKSDPYMRHSRNSREIRRIILSSRGANSDGLELLSTYRSHFGVETRNPAYDVRLVEFCLMLPESQYNYDGMEKRLIRRAMKGILPDEVLENTHKGLQAADWYENLADVRENMKADLLRLERSKMAHRLLDLPKMRQLVEEWPEEGDWQSQQQIEKYRLFLQRGMMVGNYVRWVEGGNR